MVIDPLMKSDDDGNYEIIHFVGYWEAPEDWDVEADRLREELRTDPEFNYENIDTLLMYPATPDCLRYYNEMGEADGIFKDKNIWKEKMN